MAKFTVLINDTEISITPGTTVAAAILEARQTTFRKSVTGQSRAAFCGMGTCYECRVTINEAPHSRSCQILCQPGMRIVTG
jgi:aerobic-type carbon monoxide dehydrogenase small subunit (CoxS/CutS family)